MKVNFTIEVEGPEDWSRAKVSIGCDTLPVPFGAAMIACEHMMTATALSSNAGFERALDLLVEGAKKSKVLKSGGIPTQ